jgi:geranylgeranyl pyrophosphate synthase
MPLSLWLLNTKNVPAERVLQVISHLGHAVGATGLVGGQVVDLESEGQSDITEETLTFIHTHKPERYWKLVWSVGDTGWGISI